MFESSCPYEYQIRSLYDAGASPGWLGVLATPKNRKWKSLEKTHVFAVFLVLCLWSLIVLSGASFVLSDLLVLRFGKTSGLSGAPFVFFFAKRTRRQGQPKLANFSVDRLSPKGVFRHLSWCSVWSFLVPLLVLRLWPLLVLFFYLHCCINQH